METIKLRHFICVCENGCNLSKASAELYITQPALSQSIAGLEEELQTKLFERVKGRLHLTEKGSTALKIAKEIIKKEDELKKTMGKRAPELSVFSIEPNLTFLITASYLTRKPTIRFIHDYDANTIDYSYVLREGKYDMYITDKPYSDTVYESLFILNDCEYAYVPKKSRFYGKRSVFIEEFTKEKFVRPTDIVAGSGGYPFRVSTFLSDIIEKNKENVTIEYLNPGVVQQIFRGNIDNDDESNYCRFLPTLYFYSSYSGSVYLKDRKRLVKLKNPEMTIPYYLVYKRKHSDIVEEYLEWLKKNYSNIFKMSI